MLFRFPTRATALVLSALLSACTNAPDAAPTAQLTPLESQTYAAAIQHYENLVQKNSDEIEAVLGLARNLRWANRADEAVQVLQTHQSRFGADGRFLAEQGKAHLVLGDSAQGVALLQQASTKANPDWRLYSALGIGHDHLSAHMAAQDAYRQALDMCPDDAAVMNNLGISQGLSGQLGRAVLTFETALDVDRQSHGAHADKIKRNLAVFKDARDLCPACGAAYFKNADAMILAAGLMGTDAQGPCSPNQAYTESANVMAEQLAPEAEAPSINIKVYFEFDSAILKPEAREVLDNLGQALSSDALSAYRFEIAGHTDAVGPEAYNQKLSERRAQAVLDYLASHHGIAPERIDVIGYGESRLLDPATPEGDVNRRVQVTRLSHL